VPKATCELAALSVSQVILALVSVAVAVGGLGEMVSADAEVASNPATKTAAAAIPNATQRLINEVDEDVIEGTCYLVS
jgi:hypothetical protein